MHRFPYFHPLYYPVWPFSAYAQAANDASPYPPVDTKKIQSSAHEFHRLMKQATTLVNKIEQSPQFSRELMQAAQESNQAKVDQLIASIDETAIVEIRYNPDGIHLKYRDKNGTCCILTVELGW